MQLDLLWAGYSGLAILGWLFWAGYFGLVISGWGNELCRQS